MCVCGESFHLMSPSAVFTVSLMTTFLQPAAVVYERHRYQRHKKAGVLSLAFHTGVTLTANMYVSPTIHKPLPSQV